MTRLKNFVDNFACHRHREKTNRVHFMRGKKIYAQNTNEINIYCYGFFGCCCKEKGTPVELEHNILIFLLYFLITRRWTSNYSLSSIEYPNNATLLKIEGLFAPLNEMEKHFCFMQKLLSDQGVQRGNICFAGCVRGTTRRFTEGTCRFYWSGQVISVISFVYHIFSLVAIIFVFCIRFQRRLAIVYWTFCVCTSRIVF
eukprot:GEMP01087910.1.p1 GENE.GEMP01087910.1~~GEMP01087910.1.p1  ORF type:complete len:215 (-),score=-12.40 GEMP01087910.1:317-913(-)